MSDLFEESEGKLIQKVSEIPIVSIECGVAEFEAMFPNGAPSLKDCKKLVIEKGAKVLCGKNVILTGEIVVKATETVEWKDNSKI